MPNATPHTFPVITPTVAIAAALLVHKPPGVALVHGVHVPTQTLGEPDIADGNGFTVIVVVTKHPPPILYVMVAVPNDSPRTMPVEEPTVATVVLLLDQLPPGTEFDSVVVVPKHAIRIPVIAAGVVVTVTVTVAIQPDTA